MRDTHPTLYKTHMTFAVGSILSGLNFLFLTPAFMPLSIDKWPVGLIFLGCGIVQLTLLLLSRTRPFLLKASMALTVFIMMFWAGALTYDFFDRSLTSMQLPIFVLELAVIALWQFIEPLLNPATAKNGNGNEH